MNNNPRILKLSNGDEIICMVHDTENNYLKISLPLKLVNMTTMNKKGEYLKHFDYDITPSKLRKELKFFIK